MINNFQSLADYFSGVNRRIFAVGVDALNRLGPEEYLRQYSLITLVNTMETPLIEREVKIFCLEKHLGTEVQNLNKNTKTIMGLPAVQEYLNRYNSPVLLVYKSSAFIEDLCKRFNWQQDFAISELETKLENKSFLRGLLQNLKLTAPASVSEEYSGLTYEDLKSRLGEKFVLQIPSSSAGTGTFFAEDESNLEQAQIRVKNYLREKPGSLTKILISEFISGPVVSVTAVATRWGTWCSNLQQQLIDIPQVNNRRSNGVFCGHDWSASDSIPESVSKAAIKESQAFGDEIYRLGFRGFFGLDLIFDEGKQKAFIIECNPRFTGVLPTLDMIQSAAGLVPFLGLHLLEFLGDEAEKVDFKAIQSELERHKKGAHLIFQSKEKSGFVKIALQPGIYRVEDAKLKYLRPGYKIKHLNSDAEFILIEFPDQKTLIKSNSRIGRLITRNSISTSYNKLNDWADQISQLFYKAVTIEPVHS